MNKTTTARGFALVEFSDHYGVQCSLQKSSLVEPDCIWLGVNDAKPIMLWHHALGAGVQTDARTGWVDYPLPENVEIHTRMHLTQDMVRELLPTLQHFAEHGELP